MTLQSCYPKGKARNTALLTIARIGYLLLGCWFACCLFTSCLSEEPVNAPTRTVLVYLAADNDLSASIVPVVEALRSGWNETENNCLIYLDTPQEEPRLLRLRSGKDSGSEAVVEQVRLYKEENSASEAVFARVIREVVEAYPADSYGLIFTSHGNGWLPRGTLADPTRTIGADGQNGLLGRAYAEMELQAFANAIPDRQFDYIVFEACLMAGVEVAYALRTKTNYLLASSAELLVPGFLNIYPTAATLLFQTKKPTQTALTQFASIYYNQMNAVGGSFRSATISLIDTREMDALATASAEIFRASLPLDELTINSLQRFDRPGSYGDRPARPRYIDFLHYMESISAPQQYAEMANLLDRVVIYKAATPEFMSGFNGFTIERHSGMTIYVEQPVFEQLNASYRETAWWRATHP